VTNIFYHFPLLDCTIASSTAHSASWTIQNWLDCAVRICPGYLYIYRHYLYLRPRNQSL